jgi:hypothetical protein
VTEPVTEPHCTVCATPVTRAMARCPNCGLAHPTRVLARGGLWAVALALLLAWLLAFAIVATSR